MAANSSIILTNIDFDTHKNTLKQYLKSQDRFKDYDFEGSNMSVLLDILSYNTFHNAFYLNMIGNEMFMDTAQLRDSVVSHAKELNYTPRSFKSAEALINITITSADMQKRAIAIPRGTTFSSTFMNKNYTFSINENIVLTDYNIGANTVTFTGQGITLYEGYFVNDTFTLTNDRTQRFILSNKNIDVSSIAVTVIEDVGSTVLTYTRAQSLFNLNSDSRVYFLQACENEQYEILMGDGITGRRPKDNSIIKVEYRISNGQLPNGSNKFIPDSSIDGEVNINVTTTRKAQGGSVAEDINSIKYNAPRHFTTQERAVTTEDYENLLKQNFPEINTVSAYGGEDLDPPQFGKVFVAVDLKEVDGVPTVKKDEYYRFLKPRSPVSIDPVFVNPEYLYLGINSTVRYNINVTKLAPDDIKTLVTTSIINYAQTNLNNFNRIFRYSKALQSIDSAQVSIISNETNVRAIKIVTPAIGVFSTFDIKFQIPLDTTLSNSGGGYTIQSSRFVYNNQLAALQDNGNGELTVISVRTGQIIDTIGTVDYDKGLLQLSNFNVSQYSGNGIKVYAIPRNKDIQTINNVILNIIEEDIDLTILPVRD